MQRRKTRVHENGATQQENMKIGPERNISFSEMSTLNWPFDVFKHCWSAPDRWVQFLRSIWLHQRASTSICSEWLLICFHQIFCFDVASQIWCNLSLPITATHADMTNVPTVDSRGLMESILNHTFWNCVWVRSSPVSHFFLAHMCVVGQRTPHFPSGQWK